VQCSPNSFELAKTETLLLFVSVQFHFREAKMVFYELFSFIPDLRFDESFFFQPKRVRKSEILGEKKEKPDFLINLYFSKPDYMECHRKVFYSAYFGAKFGK